MATGNHCISHPASVAYNPSGDDLMSAGEALTIDLLWWGESRLQRPRKSASMKWLSRHACHSHPSVSKFRRS